MRTYKKNWIHLKNWTWNGQEIKRNVLQTQNCCGWQGRGCRTTKSPAKWPPPCKHLVSDKPTTLPSAHKVGKNVSRAGKSWYTKWMQSTEIVWQRLGDVARGRRRFWRAWRSFCIRRLQRSLWFWIPILDWPSSPWPPYLSSDPVSSKPVFTRSDKHRTLETWPC